MQRLIALSILCLAACGDNLIAPVDAKFRATVEGDGVPADALVSVDVLWRGDGAINVTFDDPYGFVPGPSLLPAVLLQEEGAVDMHGPIPRWQGADPDHVALTGSVDPDALEITLIDTSSDGSITKTVRLHGTPRPLGDPDAIDGTYLASSQVFPSVCPGLPGGSFAGRNLRIDVLPTDGGARIEIDGIYAFTTPLDGGRFDWSGEVRIIGSDATTPAMASGRVSAQDVEITFDEPNPSSGTGCAYRHVLSARKWLPDAAAVDGDYRAMFDWTDGCSGTAGRFADVIRITPQAQGTYDLVDPLVWIQPELKSGQPFSFDTVDIFGSGAVIHYGGVSDPPKLSYTATYTLPYETPCTLTMKAAAYKRTFFP